jgi:hypothetical protein
MVVGGSSEAKTIRFSGYDWTIKSGINKAPGPNNWDENNVLVDERGDLHLRLTQRDGQWYCSQVSLNDRLGFGRYQFWVIGRVDDFDPNVVFGLFNYPTSDLGPDGTHEIDIEFAKWGHTTAPIGNYTVWPATKSLKPAFKRFAVDLKGDYTTHRFIWNSTSVSFQSLNGHHDDNTGQFEQWMYQPTDPARYPGRARARHIDGGIPVIAWRLELFCDPVPIGMQRTEDLVNGGDKMCQRAA